jgi:hypothetical protein
LGALLAPLLPTPWHQSGFQVMTSGHVGDGGTWTFAAAFHW